MPLPSHVKTWQFENNVAIAAQGSAEACVDAMWLYVKDTLINFASSPWTVVSSSDGVTSGASDLWIDAGDLVHHGTTRSWIVLEQVGMGGGNFQICIDFNSSTAHFGTVVISANAGFTGGSTTARPTATDEYVLLSVAQMVNLSSDVGIRLSIMQSSDGQCTRILMAHTGAVRLTVCLETPHETSTGWNYPHAVLWLPSTATTLSDLVATYNWKARINSTNAVAVSLVEGFSTYTGPADTTWGNIANEVSGEWPMWPFAFASSTVGVRGRHGAFTDLRLCSSATSAADTYPADASRVWVNWGALIMPWDGGAVNLS